jgi:hypothetical protein
MVSGFHFSRVGPPQLFDHFPIVVLQWLILALRTHFFAEKWAL